MLKEKLEKINNLKTELDNLLPMSVENERALWKKIRLDWNFNSNHIEGNTLTYGETQLLLIFDKTTGDHELREYEEMKAHDVAIHMVKEWAKDKSRDLNEIDVRELNKTILVQAYWKDAITSDGQSTRRQIKVGEYKEHPNSVRLKNGEIFEYTSPLETPQKMNDLMAWYRNNDIQHPLVLAAQLHYDFIRIHPFDDGNGRVARLLVNYVLMRNDYPPIIVKSAEKEKYLTALNKADVGDLNAFHEYMADELIFSLELSIKAAKGENIEDVDDIEKEVSIWKKQFQGNSANVLPKSDSQIYELYENGIKQLFELYIDKMKQFDDMFASKEIRGWVNGGNSNNAGIEHINSYFENFANSQAQFLNAGEANSVSRNDTLNYLSLQITLKGFKKDGTNAFNQSSDIYIDFLPFVYQIKANNQQVKENLYTEYVNIENAKGIVNHCIKKTFEQIKSQIKGNG